jgi:hypothetical protein
MLWVVTYTLVSYGEIEDFSVEGLFKGTEEEVIAYVQERNEKYPIGHFDYCLTEMLN